MLLDLIKEHTLSHFSKTKKGIKIPYVYDVK